MGIEALRQNSGHDGYGLRQRRTTPPDGVGESEGEEQMERYQVGELTEREAKIYDEVMEKVEETAAFLANYWNGWTG